ncbi:MAG: hypothetical protein GX803_07375 [Lentisphaerae bacterium]|jgi:hypothetical protein|nr:hypothetical protein [Lentisphaerota bacterium]
MQVPRSILMALLPALILAGTAADAAPPGAASAADMRDIPAEAVDRAGLLPVDVAMLTNPGFRWQHLQTEHFIVHYERKTFATRVARMGEDFYKAISEDLPDMQDRLGAQRSHIFIFRTPRDWQTVLANNPGAGPWAVSFVRGQTMYLQESGAGQADKMGLLAHEMTHLVFNRFLTVRLPLWLNEGLAEYYGEFAYRRSKGLTHRERKVFTPLRQRMPLEVLLTATAYPVEPAAVDLFYATAKQMVGFLVWKLPRDKWNIYFNRILAGDPPLAALLETYEWEDINAAEKAFHQFNR